MDSPISLRIQELSADEIESGIEQGQLHLGIGFVPPASPMLEAEPLLDENLVLIVPTSHRLAGQQMMFCHQLKQSRRMG
jgi:DNA-binding transcriptional LysR family regulator